MVYSLSEAIDLILENPNRVFKNGFNETISAKTSEGSLLRIYQTDRHGKVLPGFKMYQSNAHARTWRMEPCLEVATFVEAMQACLLGDEIRIECSACKTRSCKYDFTRNNIPEHLCAEVHEFGKWYIWNRRN